MSWKQFIAALPIQGLTLNFLQKKSISDASCHLNSTQLDMSHTQAPRDALVHHLLPFGQLSRADLSSSSCLRGERGESTWDLGRCWVGDVLLLKRGERL